MSSKYDRILSRPRKGHMWQRRATYSINRRAARVDDADSAIVTCAGGIKMLETQTNSHLLANAKISPDGEKPTA